jgi:hypothetical protein
MATCSLFEMTSRQVSGVCDLLTLYNAHGTAFLSHDHILTRVQRQFQRPRFEMHLQR